MSSVMSMHTDVALWLHNKFRNDESLWSSGGIASQFNSAILRNIYDCFSQLEAKTKIKVVLSILEVPLRNMNDLKVNFFVL